MSFKFLMCHFLNFVIVSYNTDKPNLNLSHFFISYKNVFDISNEICSLHIKTLGSKSSWRYNDGIDGTDFRDEKFQIFCLRN